MMPTLASIPESSTTLSPGVKGSRQLLRQCTAFEKPRPRSRVLMISRRPSRGRKRVSKASAFSKLQSTDRSRRQSSPSLSRDHGQSTKATDGSTTDRSNGSTRHGASADQVSELESPVEDTFEPSEDSVDLDSFPVPPSNENTLHDASLSARPILASLKVTMDTADSGSKELARLKPHQPHPLQSHGRSSHTNVNQKRLSVWPTDGAADLDGNSRQASAEPALLESVSRNIAQKSRQYSFASGSEHLSHRPRDRREEQSLAHDTDSRTSSQRHALSRFTRELLKYADLTSASGKIPNLTPTATSGATLRTVSALLPFRSELRAAGLAVTSQDQAGRRHDTLGKAPIQTSRNYPVVTRSQVAVTQVDGGVEYSSETPYTEISFAPSRSVDEWRYALIDEVPPRKLERPSLNRNVQSRCLPCIGNEDPTTDGEESHLNKAARNLLTKAQNAVTSVTKVPLVPIREAPHPTQPGPSGAQSLDPQRSLANPQQKPTLRISTQHEGTRYKPVHRFLPGAGVKATGIRRPSMTLPQTSIPLDICAEEHAYRKKPSTRHNSNTGPKTRAELAKLGQVQLFPLKDQNQNKSLPQRHQSLPVHDIGPNVLTIKPLRMRKDVTTGSLPDIPLPWASGTTSSLEEAMVRAARNVSKKENKATSRKVSSATQTSNRDTRTNTDKRASTWTRGTKGTSIRPVTASNIPARTSSIKGNLLERENREITDRDVLKGLHVTAAAACDEEVDLLVRNKTGLQIRRFLADLTAFEALDEKRPESNEQRARRRRAEMRKLKQHVRLSRELQGKR